MTDIPIIMSAPMVRALLDGRKTMTRRLAWSSCKKCQRGEHRCRWWNAQKPSPWQRGKPGDQLWVRESLQRFNGNPRATAQYASTMTGVPHRGVVNGWCDGRAFWAWDRPILPSIHMPRWASRLTLIVTATKIERLQEITDDDAKAEGIKPGEIEVEGKIIKVWFGASQNAADESPRRAFTILWEQLHNPRGYSSDDVSTCWAANPEVVAISFVVIKKNIDSLKIAA